jgi:hypothetical protein
MKTVHIHEQTYVRLTSILEDVMHSTRRDINYDDIINELIDIYQENKWGHIGSDVGGGWYHHSPNKMEKAFAIHKKK